MADTIQTIMDNAVKEGIDYSHDAKDQEGETDDKVAPSPTKPESSKEPSSKDDVKTPESQQAEPDWSKIPAHLHPMTKELLDEKRKLRASLQEKESLLKDPRIARMLAQGAEAEDEESKAPATNDQQLTPEQVQALEQLKSLLGITGMPDVVKQLQKQNEDLITREENRLFDEEEKNLQSSSEQYGLDYKDEVGPAITQWFKDNPRFQGLGPGTLTIAFNSIYFPKISELQERAANLKLIKEQKKAKAGNSESPSKKGETSKSKLTGDPARDMMILTEEAGGLDNIDFNA